jgi:periplasmic protein TonB
MLAGASDLPDSCLSAESSYSEQARKAKFQGTVGLIIVVDAQGNVSSIRITRPLGIGLDEKTVEALKTWKFIPGKRGGIPVATIVGVEVSFRLFWTPPFQATNEKVQPS